MRPNSFIYLLALSCTLLAAEATAAGAPPPEADTEEDETEVELIQSIKLTMPVEGGFINTHQRLIASVQESQTGLSTSHDTTNSLLDLVEFYIEHAMFLEGISVLNAIDPTKISTKQNARRTKASITMNVLNPLELNLSNNDQQELETGEGIPNLSLLRSFYFARKGNLELAKPHLESAIKDLIPLNDTIKEIVAPKLLEAAIDTNEWGTAKEIAIMMSEHPTLKKSSAYQYLLGRTAETGEDYLMAFDHYVKATEGQDQWAQRARIALIEMGMKTETLTLEDTHALLEISRSAWRSDALATQTLNLLVDVEIDLGHTPEALEVLGEIIYIRIDDISVSNAKERANFLLEEYYENGLSGGMDVSEFLEGHNHIALDYRFQKGFDVYSEKFADKFFAIGASDEAAREYEVTYNYLSVARDLGLFEVPSERLDALRIKRVKALLRGGQYDLAEPILAYGAESADLNLANKFTLLKMDFFNLTGNLKSILNTKVQKLTPEYLRLKANAYYSLSDWKNACMTYTMLWKHEESQFQFTDALNTLVSAYHEGNVELALKLVKVFPSLTKIPQWHEIAMGLFENNDVSDILKANTVKDNIMDAKRMLDVMEVINAPL